ncbi:uncharacterized protein LOC110649429 isoform X2 [Hevea brasiliensis]|uniref:uncharacterized protein LOC131177448 isoform X2 n=1 Tax=Hevea brasiliensis TaxID=3981 RepID=UPI0025DE88DA|nr:uncharacterized protein LOC131177448 isoform X2 [Hevea brasiliensis]XP_058007438.1 uncharacterized protein LOC110649429 isoform X2 [Hevea brasiliensis]
MSWQTFVDEHLMCEIEGNHLSAAAIIGQDGSVWAQSSNFPQCKDCRNQGSVSVITGHGQPIENNNENYTTLMHFNCKGFEPQDFIFSGIWRATSLVDGKDYEFNFRRRVFQIGSNMKISNLESKFEVVRN